MPTPTEHSADQIAQAFVRAGHDVSRERCEAAAAVIAAQGFDAALRASTFTTDQALRDVGFYALARTQTDTEAQIGFLAWEIENKRQAIAAGDVRHQAALEKAEARMARLVALMASREAA